VQKPARAGVRWTAVVCLRFEALLTCLFRVFVEGITAGRVSAVGTMVIRGSGDSMTTTTSDTNLNQTFENRKPPRRRRKFDITPWLIGFAAIIALSAGFWSILSPSTDTWSGLVFICGLTILAFIAVYVLSANAKAGPTDSFFQARTGFGTSNEFMLLINVLDTVPDAYMVQTRSGAIVYANHAYNELTSVGNRGRNLGRPLPLDQVFTGDQDLAAPLYRLSRAARMGKRAQESLAVTGMHGEPRKYSVTVAPVANHPNYIAWRLNALFEETPEDPEAAETFGAAPFDDPHTQDVLRLPDRRERPLKRPHEERYPLRARRGQAFEVIRKKDEDDVDFIEMEEVRVGGISLDLADLLENAPVAIAILARDGHIRYGNGAFRSLIGDRPYHERSLVEYVADNERECVLRTLRSVADGQALSVPLEVPLAGPTNRLTQLYANRIALEDDGDLGGVIAYLIDVTDQRSMEVQFAQSQKMQAVGQLAGGVAHDFNNLLTAIMGFCDLLLARHGVGDPSFSDIDQIRQNANRAANLVRQLLAFSRQQTLRPKLYEPVDLLSDLSILLQRLLGEMVDLDMVHGRDLGLVKVDQAQFDTAMINLAVNARDAMPEGGRLTIRSSVFEQTDQRDRGPDLIKPGKYVMIEIADTGTGIEPGIVDKIFEPFFTTKEVGAGTGLGLSTVYGIIKQMDGFIFLESEVGRGTTFRIYLPRQEQAAIEASSREEEESKKQAKDLTGMGTILLVEDEDAVRAFASRALSSRGYTVIEAANGALAYDQIKAHGDDISLIVSDVVMPEMDGPTLAKKVKAEYPDIKMIFISGYAEDGLKKSLADSGDVSFLAKPFSLKQLAAAVKETLSA